MATKYRAVTSFKGTGIVRGDFVTAKDLGGEDELDRLLEAGSIKTAHDFAVAFPGFGEEDDAPDPEPEEAEKKPAK